MNNFQWFTWFSTFSKNSTKLILRFGDAPELFIGSGIQKSVDKFTLIRTIKTADAITKSFGELVDGNKHNTGRKHVPYCVIIYIDMLSVSVIVYTLCLFYAQNNVTQFLVITLFLKTCLQVTIFLQLYS